MLLCHGGCASPRQSSLPSRLWSSENNDQQRKTLAKPFGASKATSGPWRRPFGNAGSVFRARRRVTSILGESRFFEPLVQLHFAEAEPVISVKFARLFEAMAEQVEHHDATAFFQNAMGGGDGALGTDRVMQRLAQDREVDRVLCRSADPRCRPGDIRDS